MRRRQIADAAVEFERRAKWGEVAALARRHGVCRETVRRIRRLDPRKLYTRRAHYTMNIARFFWENRFDLLGFYSGWGVRAAAFHIRGFRRHPEFQMEVGFRPPSTWTDDQRQEYRTWLHSVRFPRISGAVRFAALAQCPETLDADLRRLTQTSFQRFLDLVHYGWHGEEKYLVVHVTTPHARRIFTSLVGKRRAPYAFTAVDDLPTRGLWEEAIAATFGRIEEDLAEEQPGSPSVLPLDRLLRRLSRLPIPVGWVDELAPGPQPLPKSETEELVERYQRDLAAGRVTAPAEGETLGEYAARQQRSR